MSDRDAFRANRDAAKAKLHEKRLEHATYTAAEVKVLTEAALRLGRKEALEEAADMVSSLHADEPGQDAERAKAWNGCVVASVHLIRNLSQLASAAVSDERSGTTEPQGTSEAPGSPQERCGLADLDNRCSQFGDA